MKHGVTIVSQEDPSLKDPPTLEVPLGSPAGFGQGPMSANVGATAELDYNALAIEEGGELTRFFHECLPQDDEIARLHQEFHAALESCGRQMSVPLERFARTLRARCLMVAQRDEVSKLSLSVDVREGRVYVDVEAA